MNEHKFLVPRYIQLINYPSQTTSKDTIYINEEHENFYDRFPEVFRKLEWWEHRTIEELTKQLKFIEVTEKSKGYWLVGDKLQVMSFEYNLKDTFNPKIEFVRATGYPHNSKGDLFELKNVLPATELNINKKK